MTLRVTWFRPPATTAAATAFVVAGAVAGVAVPLGEVKTVAVVILGLAALAVAAKAPGVLFGLYLLIPFYKGAVQPYIPVDLTVVLGLLNTLQVVALFRDPPHGNVSRAGVALWLALALLIVVGVLYAPDQSLAVSQAITFLALVFIPLLVGALRVGSRPDQVRLMVWTFFAIGVLTTLAGIPGISSASRLVVLGANTINVAVAALLVPLLGLTFVSHERSLAIKVATVVLIPVAILVAIASGSRGPVLVLVAVAMLRVVGYLAHPRSVNWPRTAGITGAFLAVILLVSFASSYLPALSTSRFALFGDFVKSALSGDLVAGSTVGDTSSEARVALYGAATTMFEERPVLGFGTASFEALSNQFLGYVEAYPHDALLQFASEFGLVGASLFVSLLIVGFTRRLSDLGRSVKVLFLFFLLEAMLGGDIFADRTTWGLLLVVLLMEAPAVVRLAASEAYLAGPASNLAAT